MKRSAIVAVILVLFISISGTAQSISFEKQAISLVKKTSARSLDKGLPERPFADWFRELTGPDAGVVWQLSECGDHPAPERDLLACTEVNAVLANGNKVVIAVSVGTFKKGLTGEPLFFRAVIERDNQLYQIRRLSSLPEMLRLSQKLNFAAPGMSPDLSFPRLSPPVTLSLPLLSPPSHGEYLTPCLLGLTLPPDILTAVDERPGLMIPESSLLKVPEGVMRGIATRKVRPVYPRVALQANAHGVVEVEIVVSEQGKVIEATAVSGHPVLYSAAIEAVRKWVFKPTTINGTRVKVQSSLTLLFDPVNQ